MRTSFVHYFVSKQTLSCRRVEVGHDLEGVWSGRQGFGFVFCGTPGMPFVDIGVYIACLIVRVCSPFCRLLAVCSYIFCPRGSGTVGVLLRNGMVEEVGRRAVDVVIVGLVHVGSLHVVTIIC